MSVKNDTDIFLTLVRVKAGLRKMGLKHVEFERGILQLVAGSQLLFVVMRKPVSWEAFSQCLSRKKFSCEVKEQGFIMGTYVGKNIVLLLRDDGLCILTDREASAGEIGNWKL